MKMFIIVNETFKVFLHQCIWSRSLTTTDNYNQKSKAVTHHQVIKSSYDSHNIPDVITKGWNQQWKTLEHHGVGESAKVNILELARRRLQFRLKKT
jgi:hypothetical protein